MAVVVDEFTSVQPEPAAQRGSEESHEGGGDQGSSPEHDVTKVMEWQASRSETEWTHLPNLVKRINLSAFYCG